ncbi:MAG TPA: hypothetical protein VGM51_02120 [Armatimonadota bacterium]
MKKQPATSVGEVVFITAIAGFLMSIVSPIVAGRLTGDAAVCSNNERQIGVALRLYADDYDGTFPPNRLSSPRQVWRDVVFPYLALDTARAQTLFTCPTNFAAFDSGGDESQRWPRSYAYNAGLMYGKYVLTAGATDTVRITDVKTPGRYMLLLETRNAAPDLGPWMIDGNATPDGSWSNPDVRYWNQLPSTGKGVFHHHDKYMNVVMVDGRASAVTLPQTIAVPQMWNAWQPADAYTGKLAGMLDEYK